MHPENPGEEKAVKVNCSFCGKEMECPEDMLKESKKHMCYECFITKEPSDETIKNVHVDMPLDKLPEIAASGLADEMVKEVFPELWTERKAELKELSKKDLAQEMFGTGILLGVRTFMESIKQLEEEDTDKKPDHAKKAQTGLAT